jgi:uncharacterized protein (DUF58 family)
MYRTQESSLQKHHTGEIAHRMIGDTRSVYRGYGLDYEESRQYQFGDELRFMNWRLTARTGQMYMKVFREERRASVFIVVDRRAGMRFGTRERLKVEQAARAATVVAFKALKQNVAVGGVILDTSPHWIPETSGEQGVFNLVNAACAPCPPINDNVPTEKISMVNILRLLQNMLTRGTIIYIISDLHDLSANTQPSIMQLASEHQLCAIHILDPAEKELPPAGLVRLHSPGASTSQTVDTGNSDTRSVYKTSADIFHAERKNIFEASGIPYIELETQHDAPEELIPVF